MKSECIIADRNRFFREWDIHSIASDLRKNIYERHPNDAESVRLWVQANLEQGCLNGRPTVKITIRRSVSSGRPWTTFGHLPASSFTPRTRFYSRAGFYRPRMR
jgi:hypothetical protein